MTLRGLVRPQILIWLQVQDLNLGCAQIGLAEVALPGLLPPREDIGGRPPAFGETDVVAFHADGKLVLRTGERRLTAPRPPVSDEAPHITRNGHSGAVSGLSGFGRKGGKLPFGGLILAFRSPCLTAQKR